MERERNGVSRALGCVNAVEAMNIWHPGVDVLAEVLVRALHDGTGDGKNHQFVAKVGFANNATTSGTPERRPAMARKSSSRDHAPGKRSGQKV
jgi:hypothetical protein